MSSSNVQSDNSLLSRLDRAVLRVEAALNLIGGATILLLVLMAVWNVIGRKLFNAPVPGYVDWTSQFMILFAFLGLSYCQREGGHIRMDIVVMRLRGRTLWFAELLSVLFMLILTTGLIYGSWHHFLRSFDWDMALFSRDSSIDIGLPLWPAKLIVPLALSLLWVRLVLQVWGYARGLRQGGDAPVAVPLPEDPMEQASREAETVSGHDKG
ncbi:TRAP-type C4-dicarboxylate transport system, small permease component [Roseibacterium elongatum DSM 19469]|uniref:TRAP transporter small permease protein n=1 Tax=Roseicyclus elongatus DSM 19469 TaxID=1294273 RepID=W8SRV1_9RHOB|nr:TRAP transporter small permease [Roseibacterium elongatum]AHM05265.1 TRAP-type C4-dicarboxylate transport system, small permease component [Roseibacterium elongatum DSM 19469]